MTFPDVLVLLLIPNSQGQNKYKGYIWAAKTSENCWRIKWKGCHFLFFMGPEDSKNRETSQTKLEEDRHARPIGCHLYLWNREASRTKPEEDRPARPAHWLSSLSASTAWGSGCGLQGDGTAALSCSKSWAGTNMAPSRFRAKSYKKHGPNKPLPIQKSLVLEESTDCAFTPSDS